MNCYLLTHCAGMASTFSTKRIIDFPKLDHSQLDRPEVDRPEADRPRKDRNRQMDYATPADFCQLFDNRIDDLYTLSLLLTADRHQAEQCFVSGLDHCLQGNPVFREWAHSWAKRMVIKNAIRMIKPLPNQPETASGMAEPISETPTAATAITTLPPLDRFAYVMSVLEKYSDRECSLLLDCTVEKVVDARMRALQRLAHAGSRKGPAQTAVTQGAA
jgi:DNA-directed RNA polymerase specialized sigma24 family protein